MDLAVTLTVCLGIIVMLILVCVVAVINPGLITQLIGSYTTTKGIGICGILLFFYYILRLVYRRRRQNA